jgi:hypothetical protein
MLRVERTVGERRRVIIEVPKEELVSALEFSPGEVEILVRSSYIAVYSSRRSIGLYVPAKSLSFIDLDADFRISISADDLLDIVKDIQEEEVRLEITKFNLYIT